MDKLIEGLIIDFLTHSYPIIRIRVPNRLGFPLPNGGLKTNSNFKRTIRINSNKIFKMSDKDEQYRALYTLSDILCRVFDISQDEAIPIVKLHLHIK